MRSVRFDVSLTVALLAACAAPDGVMVRLRRPDGTSGSATALHFSAWQDGMRYQESLPLQKPGGGAFFADSDEERFVLQPFPQTQTLEVEFVGEWSNTPFIAPKRDIPITKDEAIIDFLSKEQAGTDLAGLDFSGIDFAGDHATQDLADADLTVGDFAVALDMAAPPPDMVCVSNSPCLIDPCPKSVSCTGMDEQAPTGKCWQHFNGFPDAGTAAVGGIFHTCLSATNSLEACESTGLSCNPETEPVCAECSGHKTQDGMLFWCTNGDTKYQGCTTENVSRFY